MEQRNRKFPEGVAVVKTPGASLIETRVSKLEVSRAGGQGVAVFNGPGPLETMGGPAKLQVSRAGCQGIAVVKKPAPGPIETMSSLLSGRMLTGNRVHGGPTHSSC